MKPRASPPGFRRVRRDRQIQEVVHDSYQTRSKPAEPTLCPDCGALFHGGRRQRLPAPAQPHRERYPACHRIHDKFPAGYVALDGDLLRGHREEVIHLLRHVESRQNAEHPLQRIMDVAQDHDGFTVTTRAQH